jgi:5,10-methenyltetrahydrofolate synthetase
VVTALPQVLGAGQALQWRRWDETAALSADRMGLMFPADGELIEPDLWLIPGNAFDDSGFRLGYGAGFFDICLAQARPRPIAVGVGYSIARVPDLRPQAHDLPMNWLVTEHGIESTDRRLGSV